MKFCINTDREDYGLPRFLVEQIEKLGLRDDSSGIVFNIDSVGGAKGWKDGDLTIYLEGDECWTQGSRKDRYEKVDILYIIQQNCLHFYPNNTKVLRMGVDPEYHYPRDVKKEYDYVFVGRTGGNPVYDHRASVLDELKQRTNKILITEGTKDTYCDLMSSGKIILNVLPRKGDDVCLNYRILEGMAIGVMMTDYDKGLEDWGIKPNVHYLPIERFGEDFSDEELARIHEVGRKYACDNFSYQEAVKTIIRDVEEFLAKK